jgi:hypothetical protein
MAQKMGFDLVDTQKDAWLEQTKLLQEILKPHQGAIHLEFSVPRMGKWIDAILVIGPVVFVLEFKVGEKRFLTKDVDQVMDYALDLRNFHEGSHHVHIAPVLVCTKARSDRVQIADMVPKDRLLEASRTNAKSLSDVIRSTLKLVQGEDIPIEKWAKSGYKPTPTIIEAALALYRGHSVRSISRSDAGAKNLQVTSGSVASIIESAKKSGEKAVCFVTGVPGAGKTLVGLDAAARHLQKTDELQTVYLSGNGPLVKVLREVLARDKVRQEKLKGNEIKKKDALEAVEPIIQNVHHFRDECLRDPNPPHEHVAVFDEAQRAWNLKKTSDFMRQRKKISDFSQSESQFLLSCLDRHKDWATVICLVGGGQEIHTGEAGIAEWLKALLQHFPEWKVYVSDELSGVEYNAATEVGVLQQQGRIEFRPDLHLATSMRSFRSEHVSSFVKNLLDLDLAASQRSLHLLHDRYPIILTRSLYKAKSWLKDRARGSERYGIVASSHAERLKPHAINVRAKINPVHWFLHSRKDVRSSYYLEDVATEFDVQGLELDYTCVVWDGDLRFSGREWEHRTFRGHKWNQILINEGQAYLKNAYRVLLTRARKGMVIVVPEGDKSDETREPAIYDSTFEYLRQIGLAVI